MASGNINCPIPIGNTLFLSAVECLHSPNINLTSNISTTLNIPLMINSDLDNDSSNNNQLGDCKETSTTLIPNNNENSRPSLALSTILEHYQPPNPPANTKSDAESVNYLPFNSSTMLQKINPSVILNNPDPPNPDQQNQSENDSPRLTASDVINKEIQPSDILDQGRHQRLENPVQLNIPLVPCFPQVNSSDGQPIIESKPVSQKVGLPVPPRPANWVSPPNIPLVFDITPEERVNIPELYTKPSPPNQKYNPRPDYRISTLKDIVSGSTSEKNANAFSQNPAFKPHFNVPHNIQFNANNESTATGPSAVEPSISNHSYISRPDYTRPLRMPLVFNERDGVQMSQQAPLPNQSSVPRPDFRVPLVLCTSESNPGETVPRSVPFSGGLKPGMLGSTIPEELSIFVDSFGEEGGHSWRPGHANALSEDFFLPPSLHQFSGKEDSVQNSAQSHHDTQSYVDSQKAELNILKYEVMNARRRINETKSAIATLSGHLKEVLKFQNIAEMKKLTDENAQLRLECQCLCMEVDYYLKGQAPLGEVDEKFYKDSNEKAESSTCEDSKPPVEEEEGDQWECHKCTFVNHPAIRCCEMCHVPRRTRRRTSSAAPPQYASDEACYCHPHNR